MRKFGNMFHNKNILLIFTVVNIFSKKRDYAEMKVTTNKVKHIIIRLFIRVNEKQWSTQKKCPIFYEKMSSEKAKVSREIGIIGG